VLVRRFAPGNPYLMSGTNGNADLVEGDIFDPCRDSPFIGKSSMEVLAIDDAAT